MIRSISKLKWTILFFLIFIPLSLVSSRTFIFSSNLIEIFKEPLKKYCLFNSNYSSCHIDKLLLGEKIKAGLPKWAKAQIQEDLAKFNKLTTTELGAFHKKFDMLFRFQIKDGKLKTFYKDNLDILPAYKIMKDMFEYLAKNRHVPNTDFLMGLGDYFQSPIKLTIPIFVFAKDLDEPFEKDFILVPDWMNLRDTAEIRPSIRKANKKFLWESKKPMLFWRGSIASSTGFREKLVALSSCYPELINAQFVDKRTVKFVKPEDHLDYKYLISVDGIRCTWVRLVWHLHSNSLVFKHQSNQVQWFYKGIQPYVHYVPVKDEYSLLERIQWAQSHPLEVRTIVENASLFVEKNLALEDMYHYFIVLLSEYTKKIEQK